MTRQVVELPGACPLCGGPLCLLSMEPPAARYHCHDVINDLSCGWTDHIYLDGTADEFVIVNKWQEIP